MITVIINNPGHRLNINGSFGCLQMCVKWLFLWGLRFQPIGNGGAAPPGIVGRVHSTTWKCIIQANSYTNFILFYFPVLLKMP